MNSFMTLTFAALMTLLSGQKVQPPEAVLQAFNQKFPQANQVKWSKENDHEYEASFHENGLECSANYTESGIWLETETDIKPEELPSKVKSALNTTHQGGKLKEVCKIERSDGTLGYEIEYKRGAKKVEIIFNEDGSVRKS